MNLVILIDSAQMFFRNFGLRHVNAALGLAIGLAAPNARQKMIARFARPVEWLRSRLRPQGPKTSIRVQSSEAVGTADAGGEMNAGDRVRIFHSGEIGKVEQVGGGFVVVLLDKPRADGAERVRILNKGVTVAAIRASASEIRKTCGMVAIAAPPAGSRNVNKGAIALSAYATRKTAQVTTQILLTSQRPYIGTESVNLIRETNPKVSVELRNFGSVQAEDAVITIVLRMNRQALCSDSEPQ